MNSFQEVLAIPSEQLQLVYDGCLVDDAATPRSLSLPRDALIHVVVSKVWLFSTVITCVSCLQCSLIPQCCVRHDSFHVAPCFPQRALWKLTAASVKLQAPTIV
jgi:hypothetical protein